MTTDNTFHSSESVEHFTPAWLIEKIRWTLGSIDFDPASSDEANYVVHAPTYCTRENDGFFRDWSLYGENIFINPPGGLVDEQLRPVYRKTKTRSSCTESGACGLPPGHTHVGVESSAAVWWRRLATEFERRKGQVHGCFLGFSLEILASAQSYAGPQPLDFACCIPRSRIKFDTVKNGVRKQGTSPTHSNVIVLVSYDLERVERFTRAMADVGYVQPFDELVAVLRVRAERMIR